MALHNDWREFLSLLNSNRVRFIVVGAHALAVHGHPRFTGDLDVVVESSEVNARRMLTVLQAFGFGSVGIRAADLVRPGMVLRLGQPPVGIDILTSISGVTFSAAWKHRRRTLLGGVRVGVLGRADYIRNKRASGRAKDLLDLELLTGSRRRPARR